MVGKASCISEEQAVALGKIIALDHFLMVCAREILQISCIFQ